MIPINENPFTLVNAALFDMAMQSRALSALIRPGNAINFDNRHNSGPIKQEISTADVPEIILASTGLTANLHQTSSTTMCTRRYEWLISTGDMKIVSSLLQVEWALFAAMCDWKQQLSRLTWNNESFVKNMTLDSVDNGLTNSDRNRGIVGWSALWRCSVEMHFKTSYLIAARG